MPIFRPRTEPNLIKPIETDRCVSCPVAKNCGAVALRDLIDKTNADTKTRRGRSGFTDTLERRITKAEDLEVSDNPGFGDEIVKTQEAIDNCPFPANPSGFSSVYENPRTCPPTLETHHFAPPETKRQVVRTESSVRIVGVAK